MNTPADLEIIYRTRLVEDVAGLFHLAMTSLTWDDRMASRKTASCGVAYNYSGISYPDAPVPEFIAGVMKDIEAVVGHPLNNCLANYYPEGASSMGFHADSGERVVPGSTTSVLSLGAPRRIVFRRKKDRAQLFELDLAPGSLLVMAASVQGGWQHGLPRVDHAGPRISLTFRHLTP